MAQNRSRPQYEDTNEGGGISDIIGKLKESLLLSMAVSGVLLFLFSALILNPLGHGELAAIFGVSGINITLIGIAGYAIYLLLDRIY